MALDFPPSPNVGDKYYYPDPVNGPYVYQFNGTAWVIDGVNVGSVTDVLGVFPIVSDQNASTPTISINQGGVQTSKLDNDAGFISNPATSLTIGDPAPVIELRSDGSIICGASGLPSTVNSNTGVIIDSSRNLGGIELYQGALNIYDNDGSTTSPNVTLSKSGAFTAQNYSVTSAGAATVTSATIGTANIGTYNLEQLDELPGS